MNKQLTLLTALLCVGLFLAASIAKSVSASGTWSATAAMSSIRVYHTATLLPNGTVLVAGGCDSSMSLTSAEFYNPANATWTLTPSMNFDHCGHTATLLANGKVLVAGGSMFPNAERYDPSNNTWSVAGTMNSLRLAHTAVRLNDGRV
jgi:hypothetical protein